MSANEVERFLSSNIAKTRPEIGAGVFDRSYRFPRLHLSSRVPHEDLLLTGPPDFAILSPTFHIKTAP
jgi:hypothetical protein